MAVALGLQVGGQVGQGLLRQFFGGQLGEHSAGSGAERIAEGLDLAKAGEGQK